MTDIPYNFQALPVREQNFDAYSTDVQSFHGHRARNAKQRTRIWFWLCMVLLFIVAAEAAAIAGLYPLKTLIPLFLVVREDGTVDTAVQIGDLGGDESQKIIRASVWRYVQERESYSFSDAKRRYELVSLMSAENVQREYQQWFRLADDGPQKSIGQRGKTEIQEISIAPVRDGVFLVRFKKTLTMTGEKPVKTTATATVEYQMLPQIPSYLLLGGDYAGIQVTRYFVEENTP